MEPNDRLILITWYLGVNAQGQLSSPFAEQDWL